MSFDIGDALLAGIAGAAQTYGTALDKQRDMQMKEQERAQEMAAQEAYQKRMKSWELSTEPPKIDTYDTSDDQGRPGKRSVKYTYDANTGARTETDLGFMPNKAEPQPTRNVIDGNTERTEQFNPATGAWSPLGSPGPRWDPSAHVGANGADKISFDDYKSMTPEQQQQYRSYKAPGSQGESETDKADMKARTDTAMQLRDFNKLSRYEKIDALKAAGIDPGVADGDTKAPISGDALQKYRNTLRDDNLTLMGVDLFNNRGAKTTGGASSTAPQAQQPSPLLTSANAVAKSPTQPDAPSMQDLTAQATAAVARGAPREQVEARLMQLMQQYGYQPQ